MPRRTSVVPAYSELPSGPSPEYLLHIYHLSDGTGKSWLVLQVYSRAKSAKDLPSFTSGDTVVGQIEMLLDKPQYMSSVEISLKGTASAFYLVSNTAHAEDRYTTSKVFLDLSTPLWSPTPASSKSFFTRVVRNDAVKLEGKHQLNFEFAIPDRVEQRHGGPSEGPGYLPASFKEEGARASVQYELAVVIKRGKLRTDTRLATPVSFCPTVRAALITGPRAAAYERGQNNFPGPATDPEGWDTYEPVINQGSVFGDRIVSVETQVSLAKPLVYVRGSVIPCSIRISSSDPHALDLFARPEYLKLRLVHTIDIRSARDAQRLQPATPNTHSRPVYSTSTERRDVAEAVWVPMDAQDADNAGTRRFMGEIHLSRDLVPALWTSKFSSNYAVCLYAVKVPGFVSQDPDAIPDNPLFIESNGHDILRAYTVEIATESLFGTAPPVPINATTAPFRGYWEGRVFPALTAFVG